MCQEEKSSAIAKRTIAVLYFWFYVYLSSMNSFFPAYYSDSLSLSEEFVGFLFGLSPIMTLLVAPIWAVLADSSTCNTRRKQVLMLTFTMTTVADMCLLLYDGTKHGIATLILLRIWSAIFYAPLKGLMDSFAINYLSNFSNTACTDHGRSARLWGEISMGITSSIIGRIVFSSIRKPQFGYAFALRAIAFIPCMVCLLSMKQSNTSSTSTLQHKSPTVSYSNKISTDVGRENDSNSKNVTASSSMNGSKISSPTTNAKSIADTLDVIYLFQAVFFFLLVFVNGLANRFMETFAYVCIRQISKSKSSDNLNASSLVFLQTLDSGTTVALCRLSLSLAGTIMYYNSPTIVRHIPIHRVTILSLYSCGICCLCYGHATSISFALVAEAMRGGMYAIFWTACTKHVQSDTKFTDSIFRRRRGRASTAQTLLEAIYKGLGHSLGGICGGKFVKYVGSLPQSFILFGKGTLALAIVLSLLHELCCYYSTSITFYYYGNSKMGKKHKLL